MEFPDLGQHCSLSTCKQLDMLPINCDACHKVFCKNHFEYSKHNCQAVHSRDVRVPVCPLCNQPVPVAKGKSVDEEVNNHINRDCRSDPAKQKRKAYSNTCKVRGCKQKELIKITCSTCHQNYCLRHRHPQDHDCANQPKGSAAATSAAYNRFMFGNSSSSSKQGTNNKMNNNRQGGRQHVTTSTRPQQTFMSTTGADLNRLRQERRNQVNSQQRRNTTQEEDDLARAIQLSLQEQQPRMTQEEIDLQIARRLQQEEQQAQRRRQRRNGATTNSQQQNHRADSQGNETTSSCSIA